jgi:ribose 1,5-bisphosphokinase PhnN
MLIMAGVLEQLIRPHQKTAYQDLKAMELEAAKEILAEVFRVRLSEVDEMIRCRFEAEDTGAVGSEDGLWPQEFSLEG